MSIKTHETGKSKVDYSPLTRAIAVGMIALASVAGIKGLKDGMGKGSEKTVPLADVPHRVYEVQPGDTIWKIAQAADPGEDHDLRETVYDIRATQPTEVHPGELQPGQELLLPLNAHVGRVVNPTAPAKK